LGRGDSGAFESLVKGDPGSNQKGDRVRLPEIEDISTIGFTNPLAIDGVKGKICPEIAPGGTHLRFRIAWIGHLNDRTGTLIALTIKQKFIGQRLVDDNQVALHISQGEATGCPPMATFSDIASCFVARREGHLRNFLQV
jgi:hypothetical protein